MTALLDGHLTEPVPQPDVTCPVISIKSEPRQLAGIQEDPHLELRKKRNNKPKKCN